MMKRILWVLAVCGLLASAGRAEMLSESWGGSPPKGAKYTHPGTLKVLTAGKVPVLVFDLSAVPTGARVYHASLFCSSAQPREPIRIFPADAVDADGKVAPGGASPGGAPLALEGPRYRSFDATDTVRRWVAKGGANPGFAAVSFPGSLVRSVLEIRYEGKAKGLPPQVEWLKAVHRDGQTFLLWDELPAYRPPPEEIIWIHRMSGQRSEVASEPGDGVRGHPRPAAVRLKTLRNLQGLALRDKPIGHWARAMPPFKRLREVPKVSYRVYRHDREITAENIRHAAFLGEVDALCAYQDGFLHIKSHGEYYGPHEDGESVIPTWSLGEDRPVRPGQAYYVHTPGTGGTFHYAVTAVRDGTENAARFTGGNRSGAVVEKVADPSPVPQFVTENKTRYGQSTAAEYWYAYWLAPPFANVPDNRPRRIVMAIAPEFKDFGPMSLSTGPGMGPGWKVDKIHVAYLRIEQDVAYGGDLCYHAGRGTLRSFRDFRVDYFSDRYVTKMVRWATAKWRIDPSRVTSRVGTHYGIRHPEIFPVMWLGTYAIDYIQRWNPTAGSLAGRLGPAELSKTVDGHPAWHVFDIAWYLLQDPGKDIPFWVHNLGGKEGGHSVEYGWQDDAKALAAFRAARQPFVGCWGGGVISREIRTALANMSWTRSVPAFSNCSLDANCGNGDPADGDPWGQINGFLFWEQGTIVDQPGRWAMTVHLTKDCFEDACTVDLTPRHCRKFKPKAGERFKWSNTAVDSGRQVASGEVQADKWSLVTLKALAVGKGKNRIVIERK